MKKIRVLVVEDQNIVRQGIIDIISTSDDILVVAEAENGQSMIDKYFEFKPDVILSDIEMPHKKGIEAAKEILNKCKKAKILFLTMYHTDEYIYWAKVNNVAGLLSKSVLKQELLDAIRQVFSGEKYFMNKTESDINKIVAKFNVEIKQENKIDPTILTEREKDIVKLIAGGLTSEEISAALGTSKKTVDFQRAALMKKLNFNSFAKLMKFSIEYTMSITKTN